MLAIQNKTPMQLVGLYRALDQGSGGMSQEEHNERLQQKHKIEAALLESDNPTVQKIALVLQRDHHAMNIGRFIEELIRS